jgi:hypothetical protein
MARLSKAERQVQAAERKQRREHYREERLETRLRFVLGFAASYVGEKVAVAQMPSLTPDADSPLNFVGGIVDLGLAAGGGYIAATDTGEMGDYATGAFAVGTIQLMDRVVTGITDALAKKG